MAKGTTAIPIWLLLGGAGLVLASFILGVIGFYLGVTSSDLQPGQVFPPVEGGVACTLEAKLCPDGSYVGRTGPKCEFSPCPGVKTP